MQKCMSDYLDMVCIPLRNKALRQAARSELTDHIMARCKDLTAQGWDDEPAAKEAIMQMGDPIELGKRISVANRPRSSSITLLGGIVLVFIGLVYITSIGGGQLTNFVDFPSFVAITLLSSAYALLSSNGRPTVLNFLRGVKTGALYSGVISMVVGGIVMLRHLDDLSALGPGISVTLISILYGCVLSAAASAAANRQAAFESDAIRNLFSDIPASIPTNHVQ